MNYFRQIELQGWRQFGNVDIDLSHHATILTGQNGTGKTTILSILSRHFGWNLQFVSTPHWGKRKTRKFWSDIRRSREWDLLDDNAYHESSQNTVGTIYYDDDTACSLVAETIVDAQYHLKYVNQQSVIGLHIPSHRPPAVYHTVNDIPTDPGTAQQHYQNFQQLLAQTYGSSLKIQNPGLVQKKSIISLALFGEGNKAVKGNPELREIFQQFQEVLRAVLPPDLGFERLEVRMPEVVVITKSGEFSLDAMSGGINALFGLAWQIHMYGASADKCTVTIDEPENHLHPSMQRALLPSLANAFPKYRFVVATHSPFIVSSFPEAAVYGLMFSKSGDVESHRLELADLAGTPNKILRDVLDVSSNLPVWVERQLEAVARQSRGQEPDVRARAIMAALRRLGIADAVAEMPWEKDDEKP